MFHRRPWRAPDALEAHLGLGPLDRIAVGRRHDGSEPEPVAEQVLDRDGSVGGHRVVELGVDGAQHPAIGELGQQVVDGLVQVQHPFLDQGHRRDRGDRLGERRDAEDGRPIEGRPVGERRGADGVDVGVVAPGHERDETRHLAGREVRGHDVVHVSQSCRRQPAGGHGQLPVLGAWCRRRIRPGLIATRRAPREERVRRAQASATVTTTLPFALRSASSRIASAARSSG